MSGGDGHVVLCVTRSEIGMIRDALELMEDLEHLRPDRQLEVGGFLHKIEEMMALHDFAAWELR
ncbi:MAG TPA: hypothetical protein VJT72_18670 [Pseudonocardiaceae bacterium]|nr:hypothetical protein [Pseudonocardiaceae bacterium]